MRSGLYRVWLDCGHVTYRTRVNVHLLTECRECKRRAELISRLLTALVGRSNAL